MEPLSAQRKWPARGTERAYQGQERGERVEEGGKGGCGTGSGRDGSGGGGGVGRGVLQLLLSLLQ